MADDNNHFECLPHFQRTQLGSVCVCVCCVWRETVRVHDYVLFREQQQQQQGDALTLTRLTPPLKCFLRSLFFHYTKLFNFLQRLCAI